MEYQSVALSTGDESEGQRCTRPKKKAMRTSRGEHKDGDTRNTRMQDARHRTQVGTQGHRGEHRRRTQGRTQTQDTGENADTGRRAQVRTWRQRKEDAGRDQPEM